MLKQRLAVALIFLPVFVWLVFLATPYPFFGLCALALFAAVLEVGRLVRHRGLPFHEPVALLAVAALCAVAAFPAARPAGVSAGTALFGIALAAVLIASLQAILAEDSEKGFPGVAYTGFAVLVLGGLGVQWFFLRSLPHGAWWIVLLFGFNWLYDAAAMFAGSAFGRIPLAPRLSPAKTREGFLGGLAVNGVAAAAAYWTLLPKGLGFSPGGFIALGVGLGMLAQAGDLVESLLKRWSGSKDSAESIPGHGGLLDKIDSALFTTPVWVVLAWLLTRT